jgi:hypothetical protein
MGFAFPIPAIGYLELLSNQCFSVKISGENALGTLQRVFASRDGADAPITR